MKESPMKRFYFVLIGLVLSFRFCFAGSLSEREVSIQREKMPLRDVIYQIVEQVEIPFVFEDWLIEGKVFLNDRDDLTLGELLNELESQCGLNIVLLPEKVLVLLPKNRTINGKIVDAESKQVLPYANVVLKGTKQGTAANGVGQFHLNSVSDTCTLLVSYVGYETAEVKALPSELTSLMHIPMNPEPVQAPTLQVSSDIEPIEISPGEIVCRPNEFAGLPTIQPGDWMQVFNMMPESQITPGILEGPVLTGYHPEYVQVRWNEIPVYHKGHMFGFMGAISSQAVDEIRLKQGSLSSFSDLVNGIELYSRKTYSPGIHGSAAYHHFSAEVALQLDLHPKVRSSFTFRHSLNPGYSYNQVKDFVRLSNIHTKVMSYSQAFPFNYYDWTANLQVDLSCRQQLSLSVFNIYDKVDNSIDYHITATPHFAQSVEGHDLDYFLDIWLDNLDLNAKIPHNIFIEKNRNLGIGMIYKYKFNSVYAWQLQAAFSEVESGSTEDLNWGMKEPIYGRSYSDNVKLKDYQVIWDNRITKDACNIVFGVQSQLIHLKNQYEISGQFFSDDASILWTGWGVGSTSLLSFWPITQSDQMVIHSMRSGLHWDINSMMTMKMRFNAHMMQSNQTIYYEPHLEFKYYPASNVACFASTGIEPLFLHQKARSWYGDANFDSHPRVYTGWMLSDSKLPPTKDKYISAAIQWDGSWLSILTKWVHRQFDNYPMLEYQEMFDEEGLKQPVIHQGIPKSDIFQVTLSKTTNWMQNWLTLNAGQMQNAFPQLTTQTWSPSFFRDWQVKWVQQLTWNGWSLGTTLWFADGNDPDFAELVWFFYEKIDATTGESVSVDPAKHQNGKTKLYHRFDVGIKKSVSDFWGLDITLGVNIINASAYKNNLRRQLFYDIHESNGSGGTSSGGGTLSSVLQGLDRTVLGYLSIAF